MKKNIFLLLTISLFIISCSQKDVIKTHGIAYLDKREKLIIVNKTNKNDILMLLGQPSTRGMDDKNLWIYIERTNVKGAIFKLGKNHLLKNNVLVLEFNSYGILSRKEFYDKEKMNKLTFAKNETVNEIKKENFIYSFLSSVRQKMVNKRK
jgi:outer membrane protein assembly factor BamE (lipoprotein component of BamABCDE complex)|tara:strand:+ start:116 stop:568 length:453 start_codon:yes stop_codon:yes gene_type:complete